MVSAEPDGRVSGVGSMVVGLYVQHRDPQPPSGQPFKTHQRHRFTESLAVIVGVNCYHIDLAEFGIGVSMDFGPTKTHQPALIVVQQPEAISIEPGFGHGLANRIGAKPALFGMPMKSPIVHRHQGVEIGFTKGPCVEARWTVREVAPQLPEIAVGHKPQLFSDLVAWFVNLTQPELNGFASVL